jgi:glycosyltransferase involved in cell wall biosynthesis
MPEIAGDGACFVDPFDVESIRQGVLKVIYDSEFRTGIVSKGRENARRFSPEAVAQRYCTIYDRVLEKNRSLRSK